MGGRHPARAHHLRFIQPRALGKKVSDEWTVPLCAPHHRALHDVGDEEEAWWKQHEIDAAAGAQMLWRERRRHDGDELGRVRPLQSAPAK